VIEARGSVSREAQRRIWQERRGYRRRYLSEKGGVERGGRVNDVDEQVIIKRLKDVTSG
jgi:hypothetical protein